MEEILRLLFSALATEALTNLLTKSEFSIRFIKKPLFKWRDKKPFGFIHDVLDCGYCTSVWAAAFIALFYFCDSLNYLMILLILHRISNIIHTAIDLLEVKRSRDL